MDYYSTLGINKTATPDEIKRAYRKLASQHHPDKGGDTKQFQIIEEAYRTLSDPQQRSQYDNPQSQMNGFNFNTGNMDDMMSAMFGGGGSPFGFGQRRAQTRNKSINIRVQVTLEEIITGKEVIGVVKLPSGKDQAIHLNIPAGIMHGDAIRFPGLGDNMYSNIPRGDIIAQVVEMPHPIFKRDLNNLFMDHSISAFEAILGKTITISTVDHKQLEVKIPAGIQPDQMIKCSQHGLPSTNNSRRGDLFIKIKVVIPKTLSPEDMVDLGNVIKRFGG